MNRIKEVFLKDRHAKTSEMIYIPRFKWSEIIQGGADKTCPAFIVGGKEIDGFYFSKYQNCVDEGCAYSREDHEPANCLTIDDARQYCSDKGKGWHLMSNAEWMAVAYLCQYYQTLAEGEENLGWMPEGFAFSGKVWEFAAGLRLQEGEIQIIPDNDSALNVDESRDSPCWRAVDSAGRLVNPKSPGTLHLDGTQSGNDRTDINEIDGGITVSHSIEYPQYTAGASDGDYACACTYQNHLKVREGVLVPEVMKEIGVGVNGDGAKEHILYVRNFGERVAIRGGNWNEYEHAGPFAMFLSHPRAIRSAANGFRASFIE